VSECCPTSRSSCPSPPMASACHTALLPFQFFLRSSLRLWQDSFLCVISSPLSLSSVLILMWSQSWVITQSLQSNPVLSYHIPLRSDVILLSLHTLRTPCQTPLYAPVKHLFYPVSILLCLPFCNHHAYSSHMYACDPSRTLLCDADKFFGQVPYSCRLRSLALALSHPLSRALTARARFQLELAAPLRSSPTPLAAAGCSSLARTCICACSWEYDNRICSQWFSSHDHDRRLSSLSSLDRISLSGRRCARTFRSSMYTT
jgi:hypothetical protein